MLRSGLTWLLVVLVLNIDPHVAFGMRVDDFGVSFDASGNIVEYDQLTGASIVSELRFHDAADQLYNISGARQVSLTHDPRGNVTAITEGGTTKTLTWDSAGRLTGVTGGTPLVLEHGDDYRLTLMKDGANDAVVPVWCMDNIVAEIKQSTGSEENFTLHLPELDSPVERGPPAGNSRETLLTDHLMSAIAAYDDAGAVIPGSETEYSAYGSVRSGDNYRAIGFHGARRLGSTGLVYLRNRIYSPEIGRFLSRDPIGFGGGNNLYSYAGNAPVMGRDPQGLIAPAVAAGVVIMGTAVGLYQGYREGGNYGRHIFENIVGGGVFAATAPGAGAVAGVAGVARVAGSLGLASYAANGSSELAFGRPAYIALPDSAGIGSPSPVGLALPFAIHGFGDVYASRCAGLYAQRARVAEEMLARSDIRRYLQPGDVFSDYISPSPNVPGGVYGLIGEGGFMELAMESTLTTPTGTEMFNQAMHALGKENIIGVRGQWMVGQARSLATNYDVFKRLVGRGASEAEAAAATPTGKMATRAGYSNVRVVTNQEGKVVVEFTP